MKNYELIYIISPKLTEIELREVSEKIKSFLQEESALLSGHEEQLKKRGQGFLSSIDFSINPSSLKNLEKKLRAENRIIKYIIISQKAAKKEPEKKEEPIRHLNKEYKKVELKEIDKKIDEILKE